MKSFDETLRDAVADLVDHGFDSQERVDFWVNELRIAAERLTARGSARDQLLARAFEAIYTRLIQKGGILRFHPGVSKLTLQHVAPHMRAELERRIMMSADLIKLNREEAIEKTISRFSGWCSSIPAGGTRAEDRRETKTDIGKAVKQLKYRERFVANDQGHKFLSSLNKILADQNGAIAAQWSSRWRRLNYQFREDHKERDEKIYIIRDSWAHRDGLVKAVNGFTDEITQPAEEPNCSCAYTYLYSLGRLPTDMLTKKGQEKLAQAKERSHAA